MLLSMSGTDAPPSQWMMPHLISYVWHGHKPDVSHLRVWKCIAYVHVQKDKCNALAPHYEKCAFIGFGVRVVWKKLHVPEDKLVCPRAVLTAVAIEAVKPS